MLTLTKTSDTVELPELNHLKRWEHPGSYMGDSFEEYFVFLGQHRDSSIFDRSNFITGLERIKKHEVEAGIPEGYHSKGDETIIAPEFGHWAVGWVQGIYIHESNYEALRAAEEMLRYMHEDYPLLDSDLYYQMRDEEARQWWDAEPVKYRLDFIQSNNARPYTDKIIIFQARKSYHQLKAETRDAVEQSMEN